jgi:oxygen-independent coproporphyrinogen-3 oxidase
MELVLQIIRRKPNYQRNSLWSGTYFFSPKNLEDLMNGLLAMPKAPNYEFSFEGHPNDASLQNYMI